MKRNEKILAGVLAAVVVGYFLLDPIRSVTTGPVDALRAQRNGAAGTLGDLEDRRTAVRYAKVRVNEALSRGLPPNPSYAERLYPQWLSDFAQLCGWSEVTFTVQNTPPKRGEAFRPVKVLLKGRATADELDRFLRWFEETALLHRVNVLTVTSDDSYSDSDLPVTLEVEGLAVPGSAPRADLFPLAELTAELPAGGDTAAVMLPDDPALRFPAEPGFLLRAGRELLRVEGIEEGEDGVTWTFARGVRGTDEATHPAGAFLELWPVKDPPPESLSLTLSETGPFRRPRAYEPDLKIDGPTRLVRGDAFTLAATVRDYDERAGDAAITLRGDPPAGLTLDGDTLTWDPPEELAAGTYDLTLTADVPKPATTVEQTVTLTLADKNTPPTVTSVTDQAVSAGGLLVFDVEAADAESEPLTFALKDPPAGARIDAGTGEVRWEVPGTFDLGTATLTVTATDDGDPAMTGETAVRVEVSEDLRPFVVFAGRTTRNGDTRALLFNRAENTDAYLKPGRPFEIAGVSGVVETITRDTLTYTRDGVRYRLRLGETLADVREEAGDES